MASTFSCLRYHIVFSTKERRPLIRDEWRSRLHAWMGGALRKLDGIALDVGGVADHVHLLASLKPVHALADVMREIKHASSQWVHDEIGDRKFAWQEGYGAFTVSESAVETVKTYIDNQDEHHRKQSFQDEYRELLRRHGVQFDERFLW